MKINIIAVGKIKEKYLIDAIGEYSKRLTRFCDLAIYEIDEKVVKEENEANIKSAISKEGEDILKKLSMLKNDTNYVISLCIEGKEMSTISFHDKISVLLLNGVSQIIFIIGGSYGLSDDVKKNSNLLLSFSKLTFPHQLFRVFLLEQIYRIFKIEKNEPYHK